MESTSDHYFVLDKNLRYIYINKAAEKIVGPKESLLGRTLQEISPNYNHEVFGIYQQVLQEKKPRECEVFFEHYQMWSELSVYPSNEGIVVCSRDITERKLAEQALQQSEERFRTAFNTSPALMCIQSLDGCVIDVNETWLRVFGLLRTEVIGVNSKNLNLYKDPDKRLEVFQLLNELGRLHNYEVQARTKEGEIITLLSSAEIIQLHSERCYLWHHVDITEQKRMEKEIARLDRLNLVGEMAASIGHEIRNPMTTIRGFLQLLNSKERNKEDRMYFDLMIEELDRANEIISEYLNIAKNKVVNLQPKYLDTVVKSLYPMLMADANEQEKEIYLDLNKPPKVLIDENEIRQLILNMTRNGLEAMSVHGMLTIGTMEEGNEVVIFIKDEGQGIPPDLLDKLGTPFVTTKDNGTGLGLAVCYSIAARHYARIDLKTGSEGTTFYIRFPLPVEQTLMI